MTAASAPPLTPELARGARVGGYTVTAPIQAGRRATVYQARHDDGVFVALKVARSGEGALLAREAELLDRLSGCATPAVVSQGELGGGAFEALAWRPGVEVRRAAGEVRAAGDTAGLRELCVRVARAYADVHERGVVHGAVHPRHVLIDGDGSVSLLDFTTAPAALGRLSAPAQAAASLAGAPTPVPDAADEQYSVAALLYLLCTGRVPIGRGRDARSVARSILSDPPAAFAEQGVAPWPELEATLARALAKPPEDRFATMRAFARALAAVDRPRSSPRSPAVSADLDRHLEGFRAQTRIDGPLLANGLAAAPTCSVTCGAAGIAFALYRLARLGDDSEALAAARAWAARAERDRDTPSAFSDDGLFRADVLGHVSPYHTASGISLVSALIARAAGDPAAERAALAAYVARTSAACDRFDLTLGVGAVVLGAALLLPGADPSWPETRQLRRHGDAMVRRVWEAFRVAGMEALGIAHGWAGLAYLSLLWAQATAAAPAPEVRLLLCDLARHAEPAGRGEQWPWGLDGAAHGAFWTGWCGGHAGHALLWTLAASVCREPALLGHAERAGWAVAEAPLGVSSLCCGVAGEVYALLSVYRATGDPRWRDRAVERANRGAAAPVLAGDSTGSYALYKGHTGLALLAAELRRPERSAMPLFEPEPEPVR